MTFNSVGLAKPFSRPEAIALIGFAVCVVGVGAGVVAAPVVTLSVVVGSIALIGLIWGLERRPVWVLGAILLFMQLGNLWRPSWHGRHALVSIADLLLFFVVALAILRFLIRRWSIRRSPLDVGWGLYLLALAPSLWVAEDQLRWVAGLRIIVQGMLIYYLVFELVDTLPKARALARVLLVWAGLAAFSLIFTIFTAREGYAYVIDHKLTDLSWARSNYLASMLVLLTPMAFSLVIHERARTARWVLGSLTAILMAAVVVSGSRAATITLGICVAMLIVFVRQHQLGKLFGLLVLVGGVAVVGSVMFPEVLPLTVGRLLELDNLLQYRTMLQRYEIWQYNLGLFFQSPLVGNGLLNTLVYEPGPDYGLGTWGLPHNYVIQTLAESGLVGLFAFSLLWWRTIRGLLRCFRGAPRRSWQRALLLGVLIGVAGALIHGTVENNILTKDFGMLMWAAIALGHALGEMRGSGHTQIRGNAP